MTEHASRLHVSLRNVHVKRVEGDENALVESHSRGSIRGTKGGVGSILINGITGRKILLVSVDGRVQRHTGAYAEDKHTSKECLWGEEGRGWRSQEEKGGGGGGINPRTFVTLSGKRKRPSDFFLRGL